MKKIDKLKKTLAEVESELKKWEAKKKDATYMVKERQNYARNLRREIKKRE